MKTRLVHICIALFFAASSTVAADNFAPISDKPYQEFGNYKVYFSVFNSAFISPEIASANNLSRAKDRVYINVSLVRNNSLGIAAKISGTARNLIQQSKELEFIEIVERDATYYLAPLFHINEEVIHFTIDVTPEGETEAHTVTFSKKLYQSQ